MQSSRHISTECELVLDKTYLSKIAFHCYLITEANSALIVKLLTAKRSTNALNATRRKEVRTVRYLPKSHSASQ